MGKFTPTLSAPDPLDPSLSTDTCNQLNQTNSSLFVSLWRLVKRGPSRAKAFRMILFWVAPKVSYLCPSVIETSRKASNRKKGNLWAKAFLWFVPDCATSGRFRSPYILQRKSFDTFHLSNLRRRCTGREIISEAQFSGFLKRVQRKDPKGGSRRPPNVVASVSVTTK